MGDVGRRRAVENRVPNRVPDPANPYRLTRSQPTTIRRTATDLLQIALFLAALNDALDVGARAEDLRTRPEELEAMSRFIPKDLAAA